MSNRITTYISKQGIRYDASEYVNHGYGGIHRGMKDLPADGYPYRVEFLRDEPKTQKP